METTGQKHTKLYYLVYRNYWGEGCGEYSIEKEGSRTDMLKELHKRGQDFHYVCSRKEWIKSAGGDKRAYIYNTDYY